MVNAVENAAISGCFETVETLFNAVYLSYKKIRSRNERSRHAPGRRSPLTVATPPERSVRSDLEAIERKTVTDPQNKAGSIPCTARDIGQSGRNHNGNIAKGCNR
jgi:hypothetical protein